MISSLNTYSLFFLRLFYIPHTVGILFENAGNADLLIFQVWYFFLFLYVKVSQHFCYLEKKENNMIPFDVRGEQLENFPAVDARKQTARMGGVRW